MARGFGMDINEIARRAGVSRATVSRYLNDGYVSQEKRELIGRVIDETGYVPSQHAQSLRTGKTHLVGVIIPRLNSESVNRMVNGITKVLVHKGYQTILGNTNNDEKLEVEYLNMFSERNKVDGVILIATVFTLAHRRAMRGLDVPVVVLGQELAGHSCVFQDDYRAVYDLTRQVLHTSSCPAYVGVLENDISAGKMRRKGFLDACRDVGIEPAPSAVMVGDFSVDAGYSCTEQLIQTVPNVDAIVCATDIIAFGAITCLREFGHRVPEEIQVTGVGDSVISSIAFPSLTTVHHFYETSGREAASMLVDAMTSLDSVPRELKMGYEIRRRESTR